MAGRTERSEGATPNGGVAAILHYDPSGELREVVELDANDQEIMRTYLAVPEVTGEDRGASRE